MIELLHASGPDERYADALMLFGRLVGSWDVDASYFDRDGNRTGERRGEWHFGWVLRGRAIQDVLISPPLDEQARTGGPEIEYGSTLRQYDPKTDTWQISFFAPVFGAVVHLTARAKDDDIVLEGETADGTSHRWVFSDVTDDAFVWSGYESHDQGRTWAFVERIRAARRREPDTPNT
jgi:hypothetical protein